MLHLSRKSRIRPLLTLLLAAFYTAVSLLGPALHWIPGCDHAHFGPGLAHHTHLGHSHAGHSHPHTAKAGDETSSCCCGTEKAPELPQGGAAFSAPAEREALGEHHCAICQFFAQGQLAVDFAPHFAGFEASLADSTAIEEKPAGLAPRAHRPRGPPTAAAIS